MQAQNFFFFFTSVGAKPICLLCLSVFKESVIRKHFKAVLTLMPLYFEPGCMQPTKLFCPILSSYRTRELHLQRYKWILAHTKKPLTGAQALRVSMVSSVEEVDEVSVFSGGSTWSNSF